MAIEKFDVEDTDALFPAADLTGKEGCAADLTGSGLNLASAGAAGRVYGIILQGSVTTARTTVQLHGLAKVLSSGNIAKGSSVAVATGGKAALATTGQPAFGIAREAAVNNQVFAVRLLPHVAL